MSEAQALIDDIAAEYPDLRSDAELLQLDQGTGTGEGEEAEGDADGGPQPGDMAGLTDEALRQFANAAAMHYELNQGDREGDGEGGEKHQQQQEEEYGDAAQSLAQVVSGSIPPPPRPTYETTHRAHPELTLQSPIIPSPVNVSAPPKRKRPSEEYVPTAQPIQAQGPRGKKHRLDGGAGEGGMIDPAITDDPSAAAGSSLSPRGMEGLVQQGMYGRVPPALQPMIAPQGQAQVSGRGRKPRAHGEEVLGMTDGGAEGSDGGRKENKDER